MRNLIKAILFIMLAFSPSTTVLSSGGTLDLPYSVTIPTEETGAVG